MQRYNLNLKGGTYTESPMYTLTPIYRQQVVPGQTVDLDVELSAKTAALTQNVTTPALVSMWFFYVPHRLVWDGWTSFISKEDGAPAFPTSTVAWASGFERGGTALNNSVLYRRAYKTVYNEYFGSQNIGQANGAWFDDLTDDAYIGVLRTKNPEQFISKLQLDGTVVDPEFNVTGALIPLNDFYRQMMNARSQQRSQMTGDKYVDTLARMGVDASWMIAERPEFLGTKSKLVGPALVANTSATNLGEEAARFQSKLALSVRGKHFAEHGYIIGVASVRPILMFAGRGANDQYNGPEWIDSFYSADNLETKDTVYGNGLGALSSPTNYAQRFAILKNGQWLSGADNGSPWTINQTNSIVEDLIYPDFAGLPVGPELGGSQVAFTSQISMGGKTPVPNRVA